MGRGHVFHKPMVPQVPRVPASSGPTEANDDANEPVKEYPGQRLAGQRLAGCNALYIRPAACHH